MKNIIIIFMAVIMAAPVFSAANPPREEVITTKVNLLCQDHPEKSCMEIYDYCHEALETGNECYLID